MPARSTQVCCSQQGDIYMDEQLAVQISGPSRRTTGRTQAQVAFLRRQGQPNQQPLHREAIASATREWIIPALVRKFLADRPSSEQAPATESCPSQFREALVRGPGERSCEGSEHGATNKLSPSSDTRPFLLVNPGRPTARKTSSGRKASGEELPPASQTPGLGRTLRRTSPDPPEFECPGLGPKLDHEVGLSGSVQGGSGLTPHHKP
jgi:hypothetical protein